MADTSQRMSDAKKEKPKKKTLKDKLADGIIEKRKVQMYSMSPIIKNKEKSEPLPESKKAIKIVEKEPKEDT